MISFDPLKKLMKDRNMTLSSLSELTGIHVSQIGAILNYKTIPKTNFIEPLCNALHCNIQDVIEWREGEVVKEKRYKVNWDKITISLRQLALATDIKPATMATQRRLDLSVKYSDIKKMAEILNLDPKELINDVQ